MTLEVLSCIYSHHHLPIYLCSWNQKEKDFAPYPRRGHYFTPRRHFRPRTSLSATTQQQRTSRLFSSSQSTLLKGHRDRAYRLSPAVVDWTLHRPIALPYL